MKSILLMLLLTVAASAQESLDFYIENAKPVEAHKRLAGLTGPWKVTTKLWFDPSGEPQVARGTGSGRAILGGRFVVVETDVKGQPDAESFTLFGFDRRTGEYTLVGADTLGTYTISAAGKEEDQRILLRGSYAQPPSGMTQKYLFVWKRPSEREHLLTLYFDMAGKHVRVAETHLGRP